MSEQLTLTAETRERAGKGASRAHRRDGRVPAVIYGAGETPASIHVEEKVLVKMLSTGHFMNSIVMIEAGGAPMRTLPKAVQFHPVNDRPIHVDFLRIGEHSKVTVNVPVHFTDEDDSPGIKRGGMLNILRHELELLCDASEIPGEINISLTGLEIGDAILISQVDLPTGAVVKAEDTDFALATVVMSGSLQSAEAEDEEAPAADAVPSDKGGDAD